MPGRKTPIAAKRQELNVIGRVNGVVTYRDVVQ
jgi:hypothetical protein